MVNFWLTIWSDHSQDAATAEQARSSMFFYLTVYIMLGVATVCVTSLSAFAIAFASIRASVTLHEDLLMSVFGAPSSWFMSNPVGRIVNRFNSDIDKVSIGILSQLGKIAFRPSEWFCLFLIHLWFCHAL